MHNITVSVSQQ